MDKKSIGLISKLINLNELIRDEAKQNDCESFIVIILELLT